MHRRLRLQHHKHTGKLLAHKHTSFWAIALIMLLTGVCIQGFQHIAYADDLTVTASVEASTPSQAAQINHPVSGATLTDSYIQVAGSCQQVSPLTIVSIYRNNTLAGSTVCSLDGTFSVGILLDEGSNELVAKSASITGQYGPDSSIVTVFLGPSSIGGSLKFSIQSPNAYVTFGPNLKAIWRGAFVHGTPPYKIEIDWGDGTNKSFTVYDSSEQVFSHRYFKMKSYIITVTAVDSDGTSIRQEFAAVTPYAASLAIIDSKGNQPPSIAGINNYVYIYTTYILVLIVAGLTWYDLKQKRAVPVRQHVRHPQTRQRRSG